MVIFLRLRQRTFCAPSPSAPLQKTIAVNGSKKVMPKSPKLARKSKSESTKEEMSAIMITDL